MYVWTLLRVAFIFWARLRKTGDTECSEQGGDSHEREQSTKAHLRKSVPLRGLPLVRWSVLRRSRQGECRWSRFVIEVAGRLTLVAVARHQHDDAPLVDILQVDGGRGTQIAREGLRGLDHYLLPDPRFRDLP